MVSATEKDNGKKCLKEYWEKSILNTVVREGHTRGYLSKILEITKK